MPEIEKIVGYLGSSFFVKFSNIEEFPDLDSDTAFILKNYGIFSDEKAYPYLVSDGILKRMENGLIIIGTGRLDNVFCLDPQTGQILGYQTNSGETDIINSTLRKYLETQYIYETFTLEVELKETLGEYWANHKKYAKKLQEMLETVEPNIMEYETWYVQVHEKDLGVM